MQHCNIAHSPQRCSVLVGPDLRAGRFMACTVASVGDGGFTMLMGEFATAVKYKLPIKVVVLKNNHYSRIVSEDQALGIPPLGTVLQLTMNIADVLPVLGGIAPIGRFDSRTN